jgi:hypothetical protein
MTGYRVTGLAALAAVVMAVPNQAAAQSVRGVVEAGARTFTASQSFEAVLGSKAGPVFGAGAQVLVGRNLFVAVDVSRFSKDGERVVVAGGEAFPNGVATTISIVPIEVSAGWRFTDGRRTLIPYLGGGLSWHKYKETSDFATSDEDVQFTKAGFQLLGGAEWRASRLIGVAGEAAWMSVPNAFTSATGAAAAFGEDDLGGAVFRVKVIIGR